MSHHWTDLAAASTSEEVQADVCIVGAGAAGLYLASELARTGSDVVMIEAGPALPVDSDEIGFSSVFSANDYPGATIGRFFGMGGSTSRWGGALVPHTVHDLRPEAGQDNVWTTIVDRVATHADEVLERLGYRYGADFDEYARVGLGPAAVALANAGLDVQANLLLPFRRKNMLGLLSTVSRLQTAPRVYFNAVAKGWFPEADQNGDARIAKLVAVSRNRIELTVRARRYIVAAGAIESARTLLELDESAGQPILDAGAAPGCYLADHLSLPIADVVPGGLGIAARLFAPRFEGAWMRGIRLLEKFPPVGAPRSFAHFLFPIESIGFSLAKKLLGSVQRRCLPAVSIGEVTAGLGDLAKLAYYRYTKSRMYVPPDQPIHLQLDMEQYPIRENRVSLLPERDEYGRKKACIRWEISDQDMAAIGETARRFLSMWPSSPVGMPVLLTRAIDGGANKPHDAYHPVGTCRMGKRGEAVVDANLKVWGVENLWVVSTAVLPTAGTANPTFTMLCLAHHLVSHLRRA